MISTLVDNVKRICQTTGKDRCQSVHPAVQETNLSFGPCQRILRQISDEAPKQIPFT